MSSSFAPRIRQSETRYQITDAPLVGDDTLLALSGDGYLYALDHMTGAERWRAKPGHAAFSRDHVTAAEGEAGERPVQFGGGP